MQHDPRKYLHDIISSIENIQTFVGSNDYDTYVSNQLIRSAVERQFEIVGEALNRISRHAPELSDQIPKLRDIVDFRNVLAHGYDIVDHEIVWDILQNHLPELSQICKNILENLQNNQ